MNRAKYSICAALLCMTACNGNEQLEADVADKTDATPAHTSKVQSPVNIEYQIIGTPVVGHPVAIDLRLNSTLGTQPYKLTYRINDPTAMQMAESQSASVSVLPTADGEPSAQQVRVVPMREGRLYLNVAAIVETGTGSLQTVTAIPIQVGTAAARETLDNGVVTTDEAGNLIRTLPAKED